MTERSAFPTKRIMSFAEFCYRHNMCRTSGYKQIKEKKLKTIKIGSRRGVTEEAAEEWLAARVAESEEAK